MIDEGEFRKLALSFEETVEEPHFEKTSFRVSKKIFATLDTVRGVAVFKLTEIDQSAFCAFDRSVIYPVEGAWGKKGWTVVVLAKVGKSVFKDILTMAYCNVAPKRLSARYAK